MNQIHGVRPSTDSERTAAEALAELRRTGPPGVLTVNGKADLVVQDAKSFRQLLDLAERLETIEAVREALASRDTSEGRSLEEVFDDLEDELRTPPRP